MMAAQTNGGSKNCPRPTLYHSARGLNLLATGRIYIYKLLCVFFFVLHVVLKLPKSRPPTRFRTIWRPFVAGASFSNFIVCGFRVCMLVIYWLYIFGDVFIERFYCRKDFLEFGLYLNRTVKRLRTWKKILLIIIVAIIC